MAGFRELEGPEIGSPPMSSEWPTACSRNTGTFCRMKRPKPSREAVCRCSGPRFPSRRSEFAAPGSCAIVLDGELWLEHDDGETVALPASDFVVQQATRHGWRNKGPRPATIAFFTLDGSDLLSLDGKVNRVGRQAAQNLHSDSSPRTAATTQSSPSRQRRCARGASASVPRRDPRRREIARAWRAQAGGRASRC